MRWIISKTIITPVLHLNEQGEYVLCIGYTGSIVKYTVLGNFFFLQESLENVVEKHILAMKEFVKRSETGYTAELLTAGLRFKYDNQLKLTKESDNSFYFMVHLSAALEKLETT